VVVDIERVCEGAEEPSLAFDELHVPASPNDVVQPVAVKIELNKG
jgi:hypothetical protein